MAKEQIEVEIVMDDGSIKKGFANIEKEGEKTANALSLSYGKLAGIIAGIGLGHLFKEAVAEARNAEASLTKLNLALANAGFYSAEASNKFQEFSKQMQSQTGISANFINQNAALLVSIGNLSGQGLERATKAALDFSAATGRDLNTSFELISKAASGNTEALQRYGLRISETIPKNERFAASLALIEQKFGGVAASIANNTFEGAFRSLNTNFNDILESFGNLIVKSPVIRETFNFVSKAFESLNASIGNIKGDPIGDLIKRMADLAILVSQFVLPVFESFGQAVKITFFSVLTAVSSVIEFIGQGALALANFTGQFQQQAQALVDVAGAIKTDAAESLTSSFENFNTNGSSAVEKFVTNYRNQMDLAKQANDQFKNSTLANMGLVDQRLESLRLSAEKNLFTGLVNIVSFTFQKIGASLAQGSKAFENFGKGLANIMGDMAIQIGTTLLSIGLGVDAIKLSLFTLTGGPAIAAGLALIAVGGLLKSLGAGGEQVTAPASTGGGISPGVSVPGEPFPSPTETERQSAGTKIEVNIAGDVLDSDETGLRIVNLIQKNFDQQGTTIVGFA